MTQITITKENHLQYLHTLPETTTSICFQEIEFPQILALQKSVQAFLTENPFVDLQLLKFSQFSRQQFWPMLPDSYNGEISIIDFGAETQFEFIYSLFERMNRLIRQEQYIKLRIKGTLAVASLEALKRALTSFPQHYIQTYPCFAQVCGVISDYLKMMEFQGNFHMPKTRSQTTRRAAGKSRR